jgi:hypothetical protein
VATTIDLADTMQVFRYLFAALPDEAVVYPTENYYYFTFFAAGTLVCGSLSLYAHNRDEGILGFGYAERTDKYRDAFLPTKGGGATLSAADGVHVTRCDDLTYSVRFDGKTVIFRLHHEPLRRPRRARLDDGEVYVGPCFDESGLRFFLVFTETVDWLYWVLDEEDGAARGNFSHLAEDVVLENRTEYAFWVDSPNRRKILIGVEGLNVLQNNWYDGPFDQMPDNYVRRGEIEVQRYLEAAYPHARGRIDKYGHYLDRSGSRVAVAPYLVYFYRAELVDLIERCKAAGLEGAAWYRAITRQVYRVPPEFRAQLEAVPPSSRATLNAASRPASP